MSPPSARVVYVSRVTVHITRRAVKQNQQSSGVQVQERTISGKKAGTPKKKDNPKGVQGNIRSNMVTTQEMDNAGQETPLLPAQTVFIEQNSRHPCLPTGEATILDSENKSLIKVDVLFDTGAEVSFIDSGLARQLHLPVLEERQIRLNTFGAKKIVERNCQKVRLEMWDQEGNPHALELLTSDILTHAFAPPSLSNQDREFLRNLNLPVNLQYGKQFIQPSILLVCDLLWSFVLSVTPPLLLPSGFHILPTKLGYLVCGKPNTGDGKVLQVSQYKDNEIEQWEQYWTMNSAKVYTVREINTEITEEERKQWKQFWTMDSAGTEEFLGPEKEAQNELDKLVWKQLKESIEQRQDGYYVRLPWKEQNPLKFGI